MASFSSSKIPAAGSSAVYIGFWIDHDQSVITKLTLTLKNRDAVLLLAALSTIVGFAAGPSWKIWRFFLHSIALKAGNANGRQSGHTSTRAQQVVLNNSDSAASAIAALLGILWGHRVGSSKTGRSAYLTSGLILAPVLHVIMFAAASVLVAQILIGRTVVSRVTPTCGQWEPIGGTGFAAATNSAEMWLNQTLQADNYVRNCYDHGVSNGIFDCSKLVARLIPFTSHNTECPFLENGCLNGTSNGYVMDSGNISFRDLGMNSKYAGELFVRRRSTCAVMPEDTFLDTIVTNADPGFESLTDKESFRWYSFFTMANNESFPYAYRSDNFSAGYTLRADIWPVNPRNNTMVWKAPFHPQNNVSDTSLILLKSSGIMFAQEADDPWFSAHTRNARLNISLPSETTIGDLEPYYADRFLNIIGCYEQAQFCSEITNRCSPWGGLYSVPLTNGLLGMDLPNPDEQKILDVTNIAAIVQGTLPATSIPVSISRRHAGAALQAARFLAETTQGRLDPEQWKIELGYWFSIGLARLQLDIFDSIERPPHINEDLAYNTWEEFNLTSLCGRVKFRSADHSSLSAVGIIVVLVGATALAIASFFDVIARYVPRCRTSWLYQAWLDNDALALLTALTSVEERSNIKVIPDAAEDMPVVETSSMLPKGN
jgi:hypothetical protein